MIAINQYCPHSGKPVTADSLTRYRDFTVGFCNPGCRDEFAEHPENFPRDLGYFDALIKEHGLAARPPATVSVPTLDPGAALVLIDIQKSFNDPSWGERNNPRAEENAARLLGAWRDAGRPVAHVRHLSPRAGSLFHQDSPTSEFKEGFEPRAGEPVFIKSVNSAFIGTGLEAWLRAGGRQTVVIAGLTTPHCVSTTTRMAGNLGFTAYLVADATAAFALTGPDGRVHPAEEIHQVSLATLHDEFATVTTTDALLQAAPFSHAQDISL